MQNVGHLLEERLCKNRLILFSEGKKKTKTKNHQNNRNPQNNVAPVVTMILYSVWGRLISTPVFPQEIWHQTITLMTENQTGEVVDRP